MIVVTTVLDKKLGTTEVKTYSNSKLEDLCVRLNRNGLTLKDTLEAMCMRSALVEKGRYERVARRGVLAMTVEMNGLTNTAQSIAQGLAR